MSRTLNVLAVNRTGQLALDGLTLPDVSCHIRPVPSVGKLEPALKNGRCHVVAYEVPGELNLLRDELTRVFHADSDTALIAFTPKPKIDEAVTALRYGAFHYLPVDCQPGALTNVFHEIIEEKGLLADPEKALAAEIGRRIRALRKEQELTLKQLANRTGLSISLISKVERAENYASISTLYKLSRGLGVHLSHFFEDLKM